MRVLHVTPELPFAPGGGGGRGREFYLLKRLVELGHDVLNISPATPSELPLAAALREAGVEAWIIPRPASQIREAAAATIREPRLLLAGLQLPIRALEMRVFEASMRPFIERAVREWQPDVVVVGHDMAAAWALDVPPAIPAVLTLHNLTWRWYSSRAKLHRGPTSTLLRAEAWRYRRHVLRVLPRFAATICVSTVEAAELRKLTSIPVSVIPVGVETAAARPGAADVEQPPLVLFTGTLSYPPNSQGIAWFVNDVWARVRAAVPGAELEIVGRDPPPSVTALAGNPGVRVVGPVPEVEPYFARAQVVVVPILTGAGIRVKIIEAMAAGRASVSTSLGCEGLVGVEPGEHLLRADDPEGFADATVRLLRDGELRVRIASAARSLAEERYGWRELSEEQERVIRGVYEAARS